MIKVRSRKLALDVNYVGTLASTFWPVGEFIARVGGGVWTIGNGIAEGTKAMTAHENTAGHTSSAANRPFIAYMRSANARPRISIYLILSLNCCWLANSSLFAPPTTSPPIRFLRCRGLSMSLEKSRGRRGSVNFARSAHAFDESAGPPAVRLLAASLAALVLIRE